MKFLSPLIAGVCLFTSPSAKAEPIGDCHERWGIEVVNNLDDVPAVGATIVVGQPKIQGGTAAAAFMANVALQGIKPRDGTHRLDLAIKRIQEYPGVWEGLGELMSRHDDLTNLTTGERRLAKFGKSLASDDFWGRGI